MVKSVGLLALLFCAGLSASPWEEVKFASGDVPEAIGSYANGCLAGAHPLPFEGDGYQILRSSRKRYFAHPTTVTYLQSLAARVNRQLNAYLLIGDISLPKGGPFSSGHRSHQSGLDADIWLQLPVEKQTPYFLKHPKAVSVVDSEHFRLRKETWRDDYFALIKMAADQDVVSRIFVHPVIKQRLCRMSVSEDRHWLRKVRPWWGHTSHFHVRLNCPEGDTLCRAQPEPPEGNGCGAELASWSPSPGEVLTPPPEKNPARKLLPQQCLSLLREN